MTSRQLYLSENVIVTVQNPPVFSNTWLNGASKKTDFEVKYRYEIRPKFVWSVNRKHMRT